MSDSSRSSFFGANAARTGHFEATGPLAVKRARWKFAPSTPATTRNTPAIHDGVLFANFDNDNLYALDLAKGKELWSVRVGGTAPESLSNPMVAQGLLFVVGGGHCHAVDLDTHALRWSVSCDSEATSSPIVVDDDVYVGTRLGGVVAIDARTGTERWRVQLRCGGSVQSAVSVTREHVIVGTRQDFTEGHLVALDRATGTEHWSVKAGAMSHSGAPAINGSTVYALSGMGKRLRALHLASGKQRWTYETRGALWGTPAVADGVVCFTGDHSILHALDEKTGKERWSVTLDKSPAATVSPAIAGGIVYMGAGNTVYAWTLQDGTERWRWKAPHRVTTAPLIADGTVYVGCDRAVIALA
ncbi:PQQ-binding-like beta-propeller repeat protein [Myxococcus sp. K38C18041901]|uniref:outer membrane protein assembly factor BamB family protein n=1 Tax=Myxococcus guangdongensis TaxID=2906760 RepID=UPI0020A7ABBA|nr:PQQ-binding-like beta-propeller repeat protein [Myxococcus guangdongensis]MCP3063663.1 PQQ-binding-like beta-propeller repeat protein [Myxococcus guangdongensis]